jgi:hypothetical protein
MHEVDQTTEQLVRSVLAYAENRLRMTVGRFAFLHPGTRLDLVREVLARTEP